MPTPAVPQQYKVPKWNAATGEGSLSYTANQFGTSIQDIISGNQNNPGIYYAGNDPRLREGATLNIVPGAGGSGPNPGIVSTTGYRDELNTAGSDLDQYNFENDPYAEYFKRLGDQNESRFKMEKLQASADSAKEKRGVQDDYSRYRAGLETLGIQSGLTQYAPSLQIDRMLQAENLERVKLAEIDDKEQRTIAEARQAQADGDLDLMKAKLDSLADLRKEKQRQLERAQDMKFEREKFEKNYALDVRRENRLEKDGAGGPGGKNYGASDIPDVIQASLIEDLGVEGVTLKELYGAYPEVSTSYITSLYGALNDPDTIINNAISAAAASLE